MRITADLAPNRRTLRLFTEMNYVLVPDNQAVVPLKFVNYPRGCFEHLNGIGIGNFEVIQTTGPNEGPRGR